MVEEQPVVARAAAVAILQLLPYDEAKLAVDCPSSEVLGQALA
jgi:hypothetical protein